MDKIINIAVLRNPLNWLTIGAMVALVIFGGMVIYSRLGAGNPASPPIQPEA